MPDSPASGGKVKNPSGKEMPDDHAEDAEEEVSLAIYVLYALGFLVIGIALYTYWKGKAPYSLMEFDIALGFCYLFFGYLARREPVIYFSLALLLYLAILGLNYYTDPSTLFSGIALKAAIIIALAVGLYSAAAGWKFLKKK